MYRCSVLESLFKFSGTAPTLRMPAAARSSFALRKFKGKMVTGSTSHGESMIGLLKVIFLKS